jgi:ubiquinone/menaquinone biosynthesis C-methylase UbiE
MSLNLRRRFFAAVYDGQMRKAEKAGLADIRQALVGDAAGDVLEIGAGTGGNLAHYGPAVNSLTVTEPDVFMLKRLERRVAAESPSSIVLRAPAEDLPFEDDTFDAVVSGLVLCGVDDQPRAVREIRRVLRPGGRFFFFEHVRADDPAIARKQDRKNWLNRAVVCCDCNRPTLDTIEGAGFRVTAISHTELPKAPSFARPAILGAAVPSPSTATANGPAAPASAARHQSAPYGR